MVSAGDEVSASLWPDSRQPVILGCAGEPAVPRLRRESPASVAHGRDIDNFLSIGISQAPSRRAQRPLRSQTFAHDDEHDRDPHPGVRPPGSAPVAPRSNGAPPWPPWRPWKPSSQRRDALHHRPAYSPCRSEVTRAPSPQGTAWESFVMPGRLPSGRLDGAPRLRMGAGRSFARPGGTKLRRFRDIWQKRAGDTLVEQAIWQVAHSDEVSMVVKMHA